MDFQNLDDKMHVDWDFIWIDGDCSGDTMTEKEMVNYLVDMERTGDKVKFVRDIGNKKTYQFDYETRILSQRKKRGWTTASKDGSIYLSSPEGDDLRILMQEPVSKKIQARKCTHDRYTAFQSPDGDITITKGDTKILLFIDDLVMEQIVGNRIETNRGDIFLK